jgi:hypothetical protein
MRQRALCDLIDLPTMGVKRITMNNGALPRVFVVRKDNSLHLYKNAYAEMWAYEFGTRSAFGR